MGGSWAADSGPRFTVAGAAQDGADVISPLHLIGRDVGQLQLVGQFLVGLLTAEGRAVDDNGDAMDAAAAGFAQGAHPGRVGVCGDCQDHVIAIEPHSLGHQQLIEGDAAIGRHDCEGLQHFAHLPLAPIDL